MERCHPLPYRQEEHRLFRQFFVDHVNELTDPKDLKVIMKNVLKNCDRNKYPICQQLITKIKKVCLDIRT
ncbi:MAG: hypothetical protein ACRCXC_00435 [Legionella sp.]